VQKIYSQIREILKAKSKDGPKYKYGVRLLDKKKSCGELDQENGNSKWTDATKAELDLLDDFETFVDKGMYTEEMANEIICKGYQFIKPIMVYDVKHNGRYQARLVVAGYMTQAGSNVYSSVVSLQTL
jgi:hypothetical protein